MYTHKTYTPLRQFYAWVGFLFIVIGLPVLVLVALDIRHRLIREEILSDFTDLEMYEDGSGTLSGCLIPDFGCTPKAKPPEDPEFPGVIF